MASNTLQNNNSHHNNNNNKNGKNIKSTTFNNKTSDNINNNTDNNCYKINERHTVHWFRKGLRLHDNPALREGLKNGAKTLRCVFVIDPWFAGSSNVGINKWRFLLECLEDLDRNLQKLNSRLFVIRGQPADALPKLFKEWGTTCLTFEEDPEPFGKVRDQNITKLCKEIGVEVIQAVSHTLFKLEDIIERNGGHAPLTYNQFQAIIASMDSPLQAQPTINEVLLENIITPLNDDHDDKYGVPTLDELGFDTDNLKPSVWFGGETEALTRLERHLERKAWVASFGRPKMTPQSLLASQTGLSPYLRFGCLSTRLFYHQLTDLYKKIKQACPPLSLHGQLLWREFFYCAATKNANFDKMKGNPICVQIPWDKSAESLAKWANGQTGFPWIDAIMIQLRDEGWIHHLSRHAVACFLTRGDLWISWEEGMKVFEELLLDADWSVNAGMWLWLSCSSFFQQFFHCYCPVRFGRKADPNGDYIRRYLPILKNFPTRYIHEPWNAPESVQRAAKCIIGKDYSIPMVNHSIASRSNMERLQQVYLQLSKYRGLMNADDHLKGGSAIEEMLLSSKDQTFNINTSTPSPTTIITNVNNSGKFMCQMNNNNNKNINYENINNSKNSNKKVNYQNKKNDIIFPPHVPKLSQHQYQQQEKLQQKSLPTKLQNVKKFQYYQNHSQLKVQNLNEYHDDDGEVDVQKYIQPYNNNNNIQNSYENLEYNNANKNHHRQQYINNNQLLLLSTTTEDDDDEDPAATKLNDHKNDKHYNNDMLLITENDSLNDLLIKQNEESMTMMLIGNNINDDYSQLLDKSININHYYYNNNDDQLEQLQQQHQDQLLHPQQNDLIEYRTFNENDISNFPEINENDIQNCLQQQQNADTNV